MAKDKRYRTVKILIESKEIKTFKEIFDHIPKTVVAKDFGTNNKRFDRLMNKPDDFRLKEFRLLSTFFDIDILVLIQLANAQYTPTRRTPKKGK